MKKVIVASKNPVKVKSALDGFTKMFPEDKFVIADINVPSGVSDQPMNNEETFIGACNRANNAKNSIPEADFWIGIEGGIDKINGDMEVFAWIYILSKNRIGKARTSSFFLPKKLSNLVDEGVELGEADDIVFGRKNSKQKNGAVGILTNNLIDRTKYYTEAVILALIPFINENLF